MDPGADSAAIDADRSLDDWHAREATQDAEDAYFAEGDGYDEGGAVGGAVEGAVDSEDDSFTRCLRSQMIISNLHASSEAQTCT
jgi:hypothetical protein